MPFEQLQLMTWLIPVPPLLAFFAIVLVTNRNKALSHSVAILAMATSFVLSWVVFFDVIAKSDFGKKVVEASVPWLPFGSAEVGTHTLNMGVLVDPLTAIMLFFVPLACLMIFIYSVGYHNYGKPVDAHDKPGTPAHNGVEPLYSRFFAFLSLFAFGMLLLVVADNLLLMFMGWEIMGLCSYLLIGFWYARTYPNPKQITPRQAAIKAFMTTRVADVLMLLGIVYLYAATGTLSFREIMYVNEGEMLHMLADMPSFIGGGLMASHLIGILLLIGTIGKSAQFPLHTWLPDAMEGPTPVSAMIHAAAMVSAGVYAVIRVYPIFAAHGAHGGDAHGLTPPMMMMATVGAFTALFAATIAFTQNDVKKVLAYSTISQLGFMLAALGIGGYIAATFHLVTHAFFKALLFLGSGSIIHGMEHGMHHSHEDIDPQDMRYMGGLKDKMPLTFWTFLIGGFALAGFPFITAGFWSKDEILLDAWVHAPVVFVVLALAALMTAFYTMRQITMTFFGKPRTHAAEHAHESSPFMTVPLVILSFFAITAGWANIPKDFPVFGDLAKSLGIDFWFKNFLGKTLLEKPEALAFDIVPVATSISVALIGLVAGWWLYRHAYQTAQDRDPLEAPLGPVYKILQNKYYIDEVYDYVFVRPALWIGEILFYKWLDKGVFDGFLHWVGRTTLGIGDGVRDLFDKPVVNGGGDLLADGIRNGGFVVRFIQTGKVQEYLIVGFILILLVGLVLFVPGLGLM